MPKGIYQRKPKPTQQPKWRVYRQTQINRINKLISRVLIQLHKLHQEIQNGQS